MHDIQIIDVCFQMKEILHIVKQENSTFFSQVLLNKRKEVMACQSCGSKNIVHSYTQSMINIVRTGSSDQTIKDLVEKQENYEETVTDKCSSCKKKTELIKRNQLTGNLINIYNNCGTLNSLYSANVLTITTAGTEREGLLIEKNKFPMSHEW